MVQLPRFTSAYKKNEAMINFSQHLHHLLFADEYSLVAVISHYGTGLAGHYKAFVCRSNLWYERDDRNVQRVSFEGVVHVSPQYVDVKALLTNMKGHNAYILFYQRTYKLTRCPYQTIYDASPFLVHPTKILSNKAQRTEPGKNLLSMLLHLTYVRS